jgi:hypothetical protein
VSTLDPTRKFVSRSDVLTEAPGYIEDLRRLEHDLMRDNTLLGYLRYLLFPRRGD